MVIPLEWQVDRWSTRVFTCCDLEIVNRISKIVDNMFCMVVKSTNCCVVLDKKVIILACQLTKHVEHAGPNSIW